MLSHDDESPPQFVRLRENIQRFFLDIPLDCPYGLPYRAVYRQAHFGPMPESLYALFLQSGFRRNGNCLYTMDCPECRSCVPIRLRVDEFLPNRNQRRTLRKNRDVTVEYGPVETREESLDLCDRFLAARYPGRGSTAEEYYAGFFMNSMVETLEVRYRVEGRLMGVAIVDLGHTWLNAVYYFFDPALEKRSPGTLNILKLVEMCQAQGMRHLYLGYLIEEVAAMRYKARFKPHYLLSDGEWVRGDRAAASHPQAAGPVRGGSP